MKKTCYGFILGRWVSWKKVALKKETENARKISKSLED